MDINIRHTIIPFLSSLIHQISDQSLSASHPVVCGMSQDHLAQRKNLKFLPDLLEFPEMKVVYGDLDSSILNKRKLHLALIP